MGGVGQDQKKPDPEPEGRVRFVAKCHPIRTDPYASGQLSTNALGTAILGNLGHFGGNFSDTFIGEREIAYYLSLFAQGAG